MPAPVPYSRDGLIEAHAYLCRRAARKFMRDGLERCDLEQVAALGLVKAARRYDPRTRTPFEAYAWLAVVGELMHYVRDHERIVRLPRRLHDLERPFLRAHDRLSASLGREPSDRELADRLGTALATVAELRSARSSGTALSLDETPRAERTPDAGVAIDERIAIADAFALLEHVERRVIVGIYLLGLTQLELSRRLTLSPKRVSRIHLAALRRMRAACA